MSLSSASEDVDDVINIISENSDSEDEIFEIRRTVKPRNFNVILESSESESDSIYEDADTEVSDSTRNVTLQCSSSSRNHVKNKWFKQLGAECGYQSLIMIMMDERTDSTETSDVFQGIVSEMMALFKISKNMMPINKILQVLEVMGFSFINDNTKDTFIQKTKAVENNFDTTKKPNFESQLMGYIVRTQDAACGHWIPLRKIEDCWYNLDSYAQSKAEALTPISYNDVIKKIEKAYKDHKKSLVEKYGDTLDTNFPLDADYLYDDVVITVFRDDF